MIRAIFLAIVILLLMPLAAGAAQAPAGYIISVTLVGEDVRAGTAVLRAGKELPPRLMMPVFAGDVIFLRDGASRIGVELGSGETATVGGSPARYEVTGEIATGDDAWSILTQIAGVLSGGGEATPENMVSKGSTGSLKVLFNARGSNLLVKGDRKLWLAWSGGDGPFTVTVTRDGEVTMLAPVAGNDIDVMVQHASHLAVAIRDARGQVATARFRFRDAAPAIPDSMANAAPGRSTRALVTAVWLASRDDGAWAIEAAQSLHARSGHDKAAAALLDQMIRGWRLGS